MVSMAATGEAAVPFGYATSLSANYDDAATAITLNSINSAASLDAEIGDYLKAGDEFLLVTAFVQTLTLPDETYTQYHKVVQGSAIGYIEATVSSATPQCRRC